MPKSIQHINLGGPWCQPRLGAAVHPAATQSVPVGRALWHWLLAVAIALVLGLYFYVRRELYEELGPDADETRFPR
jgi:hypothetical protein